MISVPEAESAVGAWRARLDPSAQAGVSAHITILYPFIPPTELDDTTVTTLKAMFSGVTSFEFALTKTSWFGDQVLWLAPVPATPFKDLTDLVVRTFPGYPPYGGAYEEVTPHLTVGFPTEGVDLREVAHDLEPKLPIAARVTSGWLIESRNGLWSKRAEFTFA